MSENAELTNFIDSWQNDPLGAKQFFLECKDTLDASPDALYDFVSRPAISYSIRAKHKNQKERPGFGAIDVIDDDPDNRWVSVCFYADLVTDPDGLGDWVPDGFHGEDAMCFNMDEYDPRLKRYILDRLNEALRAAANSR
ncbi:MAG: hypothetical protein K2H64_00095 [Desulfovibrio sp.]|nr:hypothetical protein [Desulfovibrio sp.]